MIKQAYNDRYHWGTTFFSAAEDCLVVQQPHMACLSVGALWKQKPGKLNWSESAYIYSFDNVLDCQLCSAGVRSDTCILHFLSPTDSG